MLEIEDVKRFIRNFSKVYSKESLEDMNKKGIDIIMTKALVNTIREASSILLDEYEKLEKEVKTNG